MSLLSVISRETGVTSRKRGGIVDVRLQHSPSFNIPRVLRCECVASVRALVDSW
jgi:hypothetical protein